MIESGVFGFALILVTALISYRAFTHLPLFEAYKFDVDGILIYKEYKRLITSGFLHGSWLHLGLNMLTLHAFSGLLEYQLGAFYFLLLYFISLIGGNLFALYIHRNHGSYTAVGASGAVSGVIFAAIALFPGLKIGFFGLGPTIPNWLFGAFFVLISIYGIKSGKSNIGHEAHLGGALVGMLTAIIIQPTALSDNLLPILVLTVPTVLFIYFIVRRPEFLLVDNYFYQKLDSDYYDIDHKWNEKRATEQQEIDRILEKIRKKGIDNLSKEELQKLKNYSSK